MKPGNLDNSSAVVTSRLIILNQLSSELSAGFLLFTSVIIHQSAQLVHIFKFERNFAVCCFLGAAAVISSQLHLHVCASG